MTYQFFSLPFCSPKEKQYKIEGLGEVLEGDRLVNTPYNIKFRVDKENDLLCSIELNQKDLQKFRTAVKNDYYFQARSLAPLMLQPCQNCRAVRCTPVRRLLRRPGKQAASVLIHDFASMQ